MLADRPRLRRLLGGLGVLVLLAMTSMGTWMVATGAPRGPVQPPVASASPATPDQVQAGNTTDPGSGVLPGCQLPMRADLRCPDDLECFVGRSSADRPAVILATACTGRHTWETFAIGDLPSELITADHSTLRADPAIRAVCNEQVFRTVTLVLDTRDWEFEVLPPDAEALRDGDRTFRCLAGKGPGRLYGPTLAAR